jgi:AcrR family transcriptional regulator
MVEGTARQAAATTRARIVAAAVELTTTTGWSGVTMARLADRVGVSRQTVYNEVGGKDGLAEAMILTELDAFLRRVDAAFEAHPGDLVAALEAACRGVLEFGQDNRLIKAVVSATHGADTELLPLLTTHAGSLLDTAKTVIAGHLASYDVALGEAQLDAAIDMVVRVVLSHVMEPSGSPAGTAADLAWIAERVLAPGR